VIYFQYRIGFIKVVVSGVKMSFNLVDIFFVMQHIKRVQCVVKSEP